jgi:hypothetical protein
MKRKRADWGLRKIHNEGVARSEKERRSGMAIFSKPALARADWDCPL